MFADKTRAVIGGARANGVLLNSVVGTALSRSAGRSVSLRLRQEAQEVLRRGDGEPSPASPMPYGDEALNRPETFLLHERGETTEHRVSDDLVPPRENTQRR
jgi:hypothetical protein